VRPGQRCPRPILTRRRAGNRRSSSLSGRETGLPIADRAGTTPATSAPDSPWQTDAPDLAITTMHIPDFQFRKLGENAGMLLLRTALVLALLFALVNAFPG